MNPPFFSILLPTKNRSEILADCIRSALAQSFGNFELIISDNDDSAEATSAVVGIFSDPRIRYFRTSGKLPMHENWENAFEQALGDNVLVLEDKVRMVPNALKILHHYLQQFGPVVLSYNLKFARGASIPAPALYPPARPIRSQEAAEMFCHFRQEFFQILPKGLDSCAPRELLRKVKAKSPTGYLFSFISPDYASGFLLLSEVEQFYYIDDCLVYIPNNWMWKGKYSNGQSNYKKDAQIKRFMRELPVKTEEVLQWVPIKTQWFWINSVIYDFLTKYRRAGHVPKIDWADYFAFCMILILMGKRVGGDMSIEVRETRAALRERPVPFRLRVLAKAGCRAAALAGQAAKTMLSRRSC